MDIRRVFVVDNEKVGRKLLTDLLTPEYDVIAVDSGEQVVEAVAASHPALVLLDTQTPGMDGYEICRRLKQDERTSHCPVVFLAQRRAEEEILKAYEAGAVDYCVKPFQPVELRRKVECIIGNAETNRHLAEQRDEANKTAFQALTDASDWGAVSLFLLQILKCDTFEALATRLFETTTAWELHCSLHIHIPGESFTYSDFGQVSPIEQRVLSAAVNRGRIHDFGARTAFADRHCSLLVKNMPIDDALRYGKFKDYLARMIEGVEGRVCALAAERALESRTVQLRRVLDYVLQTFRRIQADNNALRVGSAGIVEQMLEDLHLTIDELGAINDLSEGSEARLLAVGETCLTRTNALFSKGLKFNEQVEDLISLFEQTLAAGRISEADLDMLVAALGNPAQPR